MLPVIFGRSPAILSLLSPDGDSVQYTTKEQRIHRFRHMEFLARVLNHVIRPYEFWVTYSFLSALFPVSPIVRSEFFSVLIRVALSAITHRAR